jgi:hypothetical protein
MTKILFISSALGPDYLCDMVFYGAKKEFITYESKQMHYMYDNYLNKNNLYGRGFTMYGRLPHQTFLHMPDTIEYLLANHFFDKIIYGSVWRCLDHIDLVTKYYHKNNVIFIDGEDVIDIKFDLLNKGIYFKREYNEIIEGVYPISFCIPEELIIAKLKTKNKLISDIIPNSTKNYMYDTEEEYYMEYASSYYATTTAKAGWDCLRHYEIMMNGCIPLFQNLENCPELTLTTLPKKEIIDMCKERKPNIEFCEFILQYTKNNLTTKHTINKIIN